MTNQTDPNIRDWPIVWTSEFLPGGKFTFRGTKAQLSAELGRLSRKFPARRYHVELAEREGVRG